MRIAVISDEISDDLEAAVALAAHLGVGAIELRWLLMPQTQRRTRVANVADEEAVALAGVIKRSGVTVSAISPGLFRCPWARGASLERELARLKRCLRLAERFETRTILVHSFRSPDGDHDGGCPPGVIEVLGWAAEQARAAGLVLLLRNSGDCYAATGAHVASIIHAVRSPALGVSWDPCHAARVGERAICDGYEWIAPFVRDVRVEDQEQRDGLGYEYTVLAEGGMDWAVQLAALARDAYQGTATVGSHNEPRLHNLVHSLETLRGMLATAQTKG